MPRKRDETTKLPAPHGLYARPPTPGQVIQVLILEQYRMTQQDLADRIGVSRFSINQLFNNRRSMTPNLALRLSKLTGTSPNIWLDLQRDVDLYDQRNLIEGDLDRIEPFPAPLRLRKLILPSNDELDVRP